MSYRNKRRKINQDVEKLMREIKESSTVYFNLPQTLNFQSNRTLSISNKTVNDICDSDVSEISVTSRSLRNNLETLSNLLKLLNSHNIDDNKLPQNAKTLLKTPRSIRITKLGGGKYFYFGVRKSIEKCILKGLSTFQLPLMAKLNLPNLVTLSVSTDGVPLCKSSNVQMWPILVRVDQSSSSPFLAGVYSGEAKPSSVKEFLEAFIEEIKELENTGLFISRCHYNIRISCVIADAPARSFVKCVKNHTGYHACERCEDEGDWDGRVILSTTAGKLRTDSGFKAGIDRDHHTSISPLIDLKLGLVSQIVLDYMHLICLGI
ncbi:hypothetical protein Ocin01_20162, partial [Orchesella cincta]